MSGRSSQTHVTQLVRSSCYGVLRQIRSIRRSLSSSALTTLVTWFINFKGGLLQRCSGRSTTMRPGPSAVCRQCSCSRLMADARKYDHVTPLLKELHWLRVPQRVQYKLCVLVQRCLNGTAPRYMTDLTVSVGSTASRRLRSASSADLVVPSTRRSTIGDRAFAVAGPRAWNSLLPGLRSPSTSRNSFKKH